MTDSITKPSMDPKAIETFLSEFRHNLRNKLSPAVMVADHLTNHKDQDVRREAQMIMASLDATLAVIKEIRFSQ